MWFHKIYFMKLFQEANKETNLNSKMNLSIVNALWLILTGQSFDLEDKKLNDLVKRFDSALRIEGRFTFLDQLMAAIYPPLIKIFSVRYSTLLKISLSKTFTILTYYFTCRYKAVSEVFTAIKDLVNDVLEGHKSNIDPSNPQDFMDIYINEINKTKDTSSSFYGKRGEESLIASMLDLFLAGMKSVLPT